MGRKADMLEEDRRGWAERIVVAATLVGDLEEALEELRTIVRDGPSVAEAFAAQVRLVEVAERRTELEAELRELLAEFQSRPDVADLEAELGEQGWRLMEMDGPIVLLARRLDDAVNAGGWGTASAGPLRRASLRHE